jgi:DNA-directed RNA polymerase specialized sigma24 family protein
MAPRSRSFQIPLLAGTPAGKLLCGHARGSDETAVARIELTGTPRAKIDERRRGFSNRSTERLDRALESTIACLRRIFHWRVPPNWSRRDWFCEIRAQSAAAAWRAACDYDASRNVPFEAFVRKRVMEAALGRYRQEWRYVTRYGSVRGASNNVEPRTEAVDSDIIASLREAVKLLSPAEKRLIEDLFWQERTEASVAEWCRVSQQAVSKRKKAVLRHLRQLLTHLPLRGRA